MAHTDLKMLVLLHANKLFATSSSSELSFLHELSKSRARMLSIL